MILSKGERIDVDDLPPVLCRQQAGDDAYRARGNGNDDGERSTGTTDLSLKSMEEHYIRKALELAEGNQRKAARLLDISRDTLRYRLKKLGITSTYQ